MQKLRSSIPAAGLVVLALSFSVTVAQAQNKITFGKLISGSGFHIPSYVAMDKGFFKEEGLDASFVSLGGRALVTAGLAGSVDFVPIPSGGAQAALSGAEIRYVVGQSLKSQWLIVARPNIAKPEDLKGKTLGYGRAGSADYDEGAAVLRRAFKMEVGKDYKVISFQGEPERIAALVNGDIDAALISVPHAPKALNAGMKLLLRTGDYIQRAGGTFWTRKAYVDQNPETVGKFIRAIAKGVMYYRDNKAGSLPSLKEHLGVADDKDAGIVWDADAQHVRRRAAQGLVPRDLRIAPRSTMIAAKQWPADKPLPDPEQFLTRDLLEFDAQADGLRPDQARRPAN